MNTSRQVAGISYPHDVIEQTFGKVKIDNNKFKRNVSVKL